MENILMRLTRLLIAAALACAPLTLAAQAAPKHATITADRTNARAEPSVDASILTTFSKGEVVEIVEVRDVWTRVAASGRSGWVRSSTLASTRPASGQSAGQNASGSAVANTGADAAPVPSRKVASTQSAPATTAGGFEVNQNLVGAVVGVGGLGSATASVGGRFEHAVKELPSLSNGILGFALDADFYHFADGFGDSFTYIPIGATANYHFRIDDRRWDPFLGAGLGYSIVNFSGSGIGTATSALYVITRAGVRYFFKPNVAFHADVGVGAAALNLGVVWKM
jgi:SH3-like domain-containing protein